MTDAELDRCYSALCRTLGEVGPQQSELLLAMVSLALMARSEDVEGVLALLERSRERLREG
jgi:hypothetical protein